MVRFEEREATKEKFYAAKKPKTNSKYLIRYLDKRIRQLVLMPKRVDMLKHLMLKKEIELRLKI